MHTNIHSSETLFRERRLIALDATRRHDLLEEAQMTNGKMEAGSGLGALESETQKIAQQILSQRVGWGEWINNFFRSDAVLDKKAQELIRQKAEQHITSETDLAIGKIWGFFRRGKRQLYLAMRDQVAEQIRQDLSKFIQKKQEQAEARLGRYSGLADMLEGRKGGLRFSNKRERLRLQSRLDRLTRSFDGRTADPDTVQTWKDAQEAEGILRQQILESGVVRPEALEDLLDRNARGDRGLENLLASSSVLKADTDLRDFLIRTLKDLRSGVSKYYRLQRRLEGDPNVGTMKDRLAYLKNTASVIGRSVTLKIAGIPSSLHVVTRTDGNALVLKVDGAKEYLILDTDTGEVTYRDRSRIFHDHTLSESSLALAA